MDLKEVKKAEEELDRQMAILAREKSGLFVRKENSAEYDTMMAGLTTAKNKMRMLRGDTEGISEQEQERLKKIPLDKTIRDARKDTMAYSCKVEENGKKTSFRYTSGADRANAATHSVEALDRIANEVKMRSTAEQVEDMLQRNTMDNRGDAEQIRTNAARSLYVNFIKNAPETFSKEMQEIVLNNTTLQKGTEMIMKDPAFQKMVKSMSIDQLADKVVSGSDAVLTSYLDATKALNADAIGKSGSEMTMEERQEFMKNASFGKNKDSEGVEI